MTIDELIIGKDRVSKGAAVQYIEARNPGSVILIEGTTGAGKTTFLNWLTRELADRGNQVLPLESPTGNIFGNLTREGLQPELVMLDAAEFGNPADGIFRPAHPYKVVMTFNRDFPTNEPFRRIAENRIIIPPASDKEASQIWHQFTPGRLHGRFEQELVRWMEKVTAGNRQAISTAGMSLACSLTKTPTEAVQFGLKTVSRNWWKRASGILSPLQLKLAEEIAKMGSKAHPIHLGDLAAKCGATEKSLAREASRLKKMGVLVDQRSGKGTPYTFRSCLPELLWMEEAYPG